MEVDHDLVALLSAKLICVDLGRLPCDRALNLYRRIKYLVDRLLVDIMNLGQLLTDPIVVDPLTSDVLIKFFGEIVKEVDLT